MKALINLFLGALGLSFLAVGAYLIFGEVQQVADRPLEPPPAVRLAEEALGKLNPENGWYPALQQPIFSWEGSAEGWALDFFHGQTTKTLEANPSTTKISASDFSLKVDTEHVIHGQHSLKVPVNFPDPSTILLSWDRPADSPYQSQLSSSRPTVDRLPLGLRGPRCYAYDVFLPENATGFTGCLLFLKDKDGRWFQARSRAALIPGGWTTLVADIRGGSPDVEPLGHMGQWDESQASQIKTVGLTFYGNSTYRGYVWVDNFRGWIREEKFDHLVKKLPPGVEEGTPQDVAESHRTKLVSMIAEKRLAQVDPLQILNLQTDPPSTSRRLLDDPDNSPTLVGQYQSFNISFEINRQVNNPFDPDSVDVRARIRTPSGREEQVFGFWYQDFSRERRFADDQLEPLGRACWQVRYAPRELGEHQVQLEIRLNPDQAQEETVQAPPVSFSCIPSLDEGFIAVSKSNPRYFETLRGSFFYPNGHNIHSPIDLRSWEQIFGAPPPLKRGIGMYEDFFRKMEAGGENVGEVWMSAWWLGIEWTKKWRSYQGMGRYSLEHAWKLDQILALARQHNIRIHLVIDNHGKFSQWCDWEWNQNPYNRDSDEEGPVNLPSEFFRNAKSRHFHKKRLRYIAARWGADATILGWEMVSEMDLIGDGRPHPNANQAGTPSHPQGRSYYRTDEPREWLIEMMNALKEFDPFDHPVTNHYATSYTYVDLEIANTPVFDYIVGDAYRPQPGYGDMAYIWSNYFEPKVQKPFWVTEYGGDWNATSIERLEADIHGGLWATWMTSAAGTPLFWWYDFIDHKDLYFHYRAFANYIKGEDRRPLKGSTYRITPSKQRGNLGGLMYRWDTGAYVWIYDRQAMCDMPKLDNRPRHTDTETTVEGLLPGTYSVEYWDCYQGKIIHAEVLVLNGGTTLRLKLPEFLSDLAIKIKPAAVTPKP